jgi:hypothetical protein
MTQMVFWMLGVAFSAAAMVLTTALEAFTAQFALATVIVAFITVSGLRDFQASRAAAAHASHQSAIIARHMGILWAWAAVSVALIYSLVITTWTAWFAAFIILVLGAALCMFLANILARDASDDHHDPRIDSLVNWIAKVQFAATCLAIGGLLAFGKFSTSAFGGEAKWAAINIMLCAAFGLTGLSGFAITQSAETPAAAAEVETPKASISRVPRRATA